MQGIAAASSKLLEQGELEQSTGRRSLEQLLAAESVDRAVRVVNHQMWLAKFPVDRDLGGFDCDGSPVYRKPGMRRSSAVATRARQADASMIARPAVLTYGWQLNRPGISGGSTS
ncbi:ATP-binding protein [Paraburkholderia sp. CNPSo 3274]|nr:ATP-binding protein [Paraburkholderia sp. CNPSo 3274]